MEAKGRCQAREVTQKNVLSTEIQIPALTWLIRQAGRQADWLVYSHSTRRMETGHPGASYLKRLGWLKREMQMRWEALSHHSLYIYIWWRKLSKISSWPVYRYTHTRIPSHRCTPSRGNMHTTYMYLNKQLNVNKSGHVFFSACWVFSLRLSAL